eukprot:TRINITY_DN2347_c0_g1_i2.p1 TRINITY_DN2347_c0_g1~~TRINITY_DN2347_c0_g1_i2.p1  ORF type:complete len:446 (-),score=85.88 TRINITY_DN2347_c0_g1_i2:178-1515(-)
MEQAAHNADNFYTAVASAQLDAGLHLPGCGMPSERIQTLAELLEDNHKKHHIFFNDKGFHNHLTHHLLAAYALGASSDRLRSVYEFQKKSQKPILPKHDTKKEEFDFGAHMGDEEYYHDYLEFFTREIERDEGNGRRTIERWLFEEEQGKSNKFYARFLSGAYHPFIHIGYGLEFNLNSQIAEGLAQAAVHSAGVSDLLLGDEVGTKSVKDVALAVAEDPKIKERVPKYDDFPKLDVYLKQGGGEILRKHAAEWKCPKEEVELKAKELQQVSVAVMAGVVRPDKLPKLDFFLMHAVTSAHFLPIYVRVLKPENSVKLLRDKFSVDLSYLVTRGLPEFHLEYLATYKSDSPLKTTENEWLGMLDAVLDEKKYNDEHVVKTIRALSYAERNHVDIGLLAPESYLGAARMVIDQFARGEDWEHDGVGFKESWSNWPDRKPKEALVVDD